MNYFLNCLVSLGILMFLWSCSPVTINQFMKNGQEPLSAEQLHSFLEGHSLLLEAIDFEANVRYQTGGKLYGKSLQGEMDSGSWNITPQNQLCMKFRSWYYGDQKCYTVFEDDGNYTFFTSNGARYYSAVKVGTKTHSLSEESVDTKNQKNFSAQPDQLRPLTPLSSDEKVRFLHKLAQDCPGCNFSNGSLEGARLTGANLEGANLSGADLTGANLSRANLAGANLVGANLSNCNFSGADLSGSNLLSADITGAIFTGAKLTDAQIDNIKNIVR